MRSDRTGGGPPRRTWIGSPQHGARFSFRALARGRHAALARVDPHWPVSVRARHPRQHGLSVSRRRSRRRRRGSRPRASPLARSSAVFRSIADLASALDSMSTTTSLDSSRIPSASGQRTERRVNARPRAPRRRRRVVRARVDRAATRQVVRLGSRLRPSRHLRSSRRVEDAIPGGSLPRRGLGDRLRARRALRSALRAVASHPDHRHGRSRRGPWRDHGELTHGVFAYESVLKVPLIVSEIGSGRRARIANGRHGREPRAARRPPADAPRVGGCHPGRQLPGTSLRAAIAGDGAERPSYFEAMTSTLTRGWAPLRGVARRPREVHRSSDAELYDLAADPAEQRNLFAVADRSGAGAREHAEDIQRRPAGPAAEGNSRDRSSGCGRSATSVEVRRRFASAIPKTMIPSD